MTKAKPNQVIKKQQQKKFMKMAGELALEHLRDGAGGPFGAVIVLDGEVVGRGWNQVTSRNDPTAHAEIMAIRDAGQNLERFDLRGCILYASCEPCPMCLAAAYWARFAAIYYACTRQEAALIGFDDLHIGQQLALPPHRRTLPTRHRKSLVAQQAMQEWLTKADKIIY